MLRNAETKCGEENRHLKIADLFTIRIRRAFSRTSAALALCKDNSFTPVYKMGAKSNTEGFGCIPW